MKLLTRTSLVYLTSSLLVFIISGLVFYQLLHEIFERQLDETLTEEQLLIEQTINFSDSVPDFRTVFGHMIDVTIVNQPQKKHGYLHDTLMYDHDLGTFASFRHLLAENTSLRGKGYFINIYKPLKEAENLMTEIVVSLTLVFLSLLLLLVLVNYFITRRIWIPFYRTLHTLSLYKINHAGPIELHATSIHEFNLLNKAIEKMSEKIRQDYATLKEFNETAAHELQTPLAIIKSKLELMIQEENLNDKQLRLVGTLFDASSRMSRLIQGLLLISKIGNNQFLETEEVDFRTLIRSILANFSEMISHLKIAVSDRCEIPFLVQMNPILAEILVTNLLSNAIRHNVSGGMIEITMNTKGFVITNTGVPLKVNSDEVFKRFWKGGNHPESTGLGLSIVSKIAENYQLCIAYSYENGSHCLSIST